MGIGLEFIGHTNEVVQLRFSEILRSDVVKKGAIEDKKDHSICHLYELEVS